MLMRIDSKEHFTKAMEYPTDSLAIKLEGVSVVYRFERNRPTSVKEYLVRLIRRDLEREYIHALDDVSIEILPGEMFGIIGRNGAGKTTLLRTLSGILLPTEGRVRVWGQVSSLLGVGAGFHPELTGRENMFLYSAILGRSQARTLELYDEIVAFSELGEFINAPLRTYSSGMIARLGFAVAMAERSDILLVDEVLGVGDEQFKIKCQRRFHEFQKAGTTIVLVTHAMSVVSESCNRAAWLELGKVLSMGQPDDVIADYRNSLKDHA